MFVYLLRKSLAETDEFLKQRHDLSNFYSPLTECFKLYKSTLLKACGISIQVGIAFWITMIYMLTFFTKILHYGFHEVFSIILAGIVVALITVPISGKLSDRFGTKKVLLTMLIAFIVTSLPFNYLIIQPHLSLTVLVIIHLVFSVFCGRLFSSRSRAIGLHVSNPRALYRNCHFL